MCLTACAQKKDGERGPRQGGHMVINKDSDSVFVALKQETLGKFKQLTFNDEQTGKTRTTSDVKVGLPTSSQVSTQPCAHRTCTA